MAWATGTASGHNDLMSKLLAFLSTNADLVAEGQQWEILRNSDWPYTGTAPSRFAFSNVPNNYPTVSPDNWPANIPSNNVKVKVSGKLVVPSSGTYAFSLRADDQCEVRIDGQLVFSVYSATLSTNTFTNSGSLTLVSGQHDIEVTLINTASIGGVSLAWIKPGDSGFSLIPSANFSGLSAVYGVADYANPSPSDFAAQLATREVVLRGPGLSEADDIYLTMRTLSSLQGDLYNIAMRYCTGYDPTKLSDNQPGANPNAVFCLLWNQEIKYWFVASGRRFIVIAKVSTTYASMYGGFILPYGLPSEYPYPIAVGANGAENLRWSDQTENNSSFWNPCGYSDPYRTSLYMRRTDGAIDAFKNIFYSGQQFAWTYPYRFRVNYRTSPDNQYAMAPIVLYSSNGGGNVCGELDGILAISGFNNASENTIVVGGKTYLVVQSAYRTTPNDYAAILLE